PLVVAPAMNRQIWSHPATQRNVAQLVEDGVLVVGPGSGDQACGEVGLGRMLEPLELVEDVAASFVPKTLAGRRALLTAGTRSEPIDPVRGIDRKSVVEGKTEDLVRSRLKMKKVVILNEPKSIIELSV